MSVASPLALPDAPGVPSSNYNNTNSNNTNNNNNANNTVAKRQPSYSSSKQDNNKSGNNNADSAVSNEALVQSAAEAAQSMIVDSNNIEQREFRIFISSPFRDMAEVRKNGLNNRSGVNFFFVNRNVNCWRNM